MNAQKQAIRHQRVRALRMLAPAVLLAACTDGNTAPEVTPISIDVVVSKPVLTRITDSTSIDVTVNGSPASNVTIEVVSETRGIISVPVITNSALARRMIVPSGPGVATLRVRSGSAEPKTITIQVQFDRPTVLSAQWSSSGIGADTTTLIGVMLGHLSHDHVRVGGTPVNVVTQTATSLTFVLPPRADSDCGGRAHSPALTIDGADVAPHIKMRQAREGEVRMAVGEWRSLPAADVECLMLPAAGGAYVLGYADMRQIDQSRAEWPGITLPPDYSVTVEDLSSGVLAANSTRSNTSDAAEGKRVSALHAADAAALPSASMSVPQQCTDDDFTSPFHSFWCRSKPWAVGDRFTIRRPGTAADAATATVYAIYDNHFVFASIDGDNSTRLQHMRAMIDESMPLIRQHAVPLMKAAFGERYPTTSAGSGQLLTLVGDFTHGSASGGCCFNGEPTSIVLLGSTLDGSLSNVFYLLAHEFTHTWQRRWFFDSRSAASEPINSGSYWGAEGGADLIALEAGRRMLHVPWRANVQVSANSPDMFVTPWYMESAATGTISAAYVHASSFLRDVVARLVARGVSHDEAFREAARGSLEDWFGLEANNARRTGFVGRMQAYFGSTWDPGHALLVYTLSQGADELTTSVELQNPFYAAMWSAPSGGFGRRTLVADQAPNSVAVTRKATSTGYVRIEDRGQGSTFRATSDTQGLIWAIARVR